MIVSLNQLDAALSQMKYKLLGYAADKEDDLQVNIEFIPADPGNGQLVDVICLKASRPSKPEDIKAYSMVVEVMPYSENQPPTASIIEGFKITAKY
jgi:hypothetical protein